LLRRGQEALQVSQSRVLDLIDGVNHALQLYQIRGEDLVRLSRAFAGTSVKGYITWVEVLARVEDRGFP
jgi:hypothetical protein